MKIQEAFMNHKLTATDYPLRCMSGDTYELFHSNMRKFDAIEELISHSSGFEFPKGMGILLYDLVRDYEDLLEKLPKTHETT